MRNPLTLGARRWHLLLIGLSAVLALSLTACYPGGPEDLDDLGLVLTFSNPDLNYAGLLTYAMADTVVVLDVDNSAAEPLDTQFNPTILQALQDNMAARGFTREMDPAHNQPDVWLAVGAVKSETWIYWYNWGYWGGYYPPGWGGGYYPPSVGGASFEQGSIVWQALDLRGIADPTDPDTKPPVMWLAGINGALSNSNSATHGKITTGINQGFAQSPYIIAAPPTQQNSRGVQR